MRPQSFCYALIFISIFYFRYICCQDEHVSTSNHYTFSMGAEDEKYIVKSFPQIIVENIRFESIELNPYDPINYYSQSNYKNQYESQKLKNVGSFAQDMKDVGEELWERVTFLASGIGTTLDKVANTITNTIESIEDWFDDERPKSPQKNEHQIPIGSSHSVGQQTSYEEYRNELTHIVTELEQTPFITMHAWAHEQLEILNNKAAIQTCSLEYYTVTKEITPYMERHALEAEAFKRCYGNPIQQQLHKEILKIITRSAEIECIFEQYHEKAAFADLVAEGADLARELNVQQDVVNGFRIASYCGWLNEAETPYLAAIIKRAGGYVVGTIEGGCNIVKNAYALCTHPYETGKTIFTAMQYAGKVLLQAGDELDGFALYLYRYGTYKDYHLQTELTQTIDHIGKIFEESKKEFFKLPIEERDRKLMSFYVELFFTGKAFAQLTKAKNITNVNMIKQNAASLTNKLQLYKYKACSEIITRTKTIKGKLKVFAKTKLDKIYAEIEASGSVKASTGPISGSQMIPGLTISYGLAFEEELNALRILFKEVRPIKEMRPSWIGNRFLKIKIDHLFKIDPKSIKQIKGLHHDFLGYLENINAIKLENVKVGKFGEYMADVIWNGTITPEKTFFPKQWTRKQVLESIIEAYDDFIASGLEPTLTLDGKYCIAGKSKSGLKIEMWIDQKANVTTAYPSLI